MRPGGSLRVQPRVPLGLGLTAEATSLRLEKNLVFRVVFLMPRLNCRGNFVEAMKEMSMLENPVEGLGLTAEATSLRLNAGVDHNTSLDRPRLNCRGNFVEAQGSSHHGNSSRHRPRLNCRGNFVEAPGRRRSAHGWPAPRLNCRGNFVEAQDMSSYPWVMQGASA